MDHLRLNNILSFAACETRRCVNVAIVDDLLGEPDELFHYTLERTPGLDPRISLSPVDGWVQIIENDDGKYTVLYVGFNQSTCSFPTDLIIVGYEFTVYTTSEGQGMVELSVIIFNPSSGGAPRPFTLSVNTEDGTAGIYT